MTRIDYSIRYGESPKDRYNRLLGDFNSKYTELDREGVIDVQKIGDSLKIEDERINYMPTGEYIVSEMKDDFIWVLKFAAVGSLALMLMGSCQKHFPETAKPSLENRMEQLMK